MTKPLSPIFVIGNPRSGTTLLRLLLTCHPNICIPPECGWLVCHASKYRDILFDDSSILNLVNSLFCPETKKFETWKLNKEQLIQHLCQFKQYNYSQISSEIYKYYMSLYQPSKIRWGDKNNFYLHHILEINTLFPNSKFVIIIRDGRDVACSYRDMKTTTGRYAPQLPFEILDISNRWHDNISKIESSLEKLQLSSFIKIRYEDLVINPESVLQTVCKFLGEDYDSKMLDFHIENRNKMLEPEELIQWKKLTKTPIQSSRIGRYKTELSTHEIKVFENINRDILKRYNYL